MDPDKAGNLCGIPHIARVYDEYNDADEAKLKTTDDDDELGHVVPCMQAGQSNARGVPFYSRAVRPHARLCNTARGTAETQKRRNSELEVGHSL